ncbi:spore coat protein [candidate division MSBL1 archaeon SCGC-AAA261G05]|uniref:Spore coat protein n=1 Tax=candidate division MSBL1 archaeon SCGC-AAA261G05 TaxID=1698276 RepID=A0A133V9N7_9EURY|nr:spore coat protein [candidate division MSBL1 archaeon SCGC-AAA261G05]
MTEKNFEKILVTGGMGFIGSNFIRYLLSNRKQVKKILNLDKLSLGSNKENLKDLESQEGYEFYKGSITNLGLLSDLIRDVDAVVNFAAETHVDRSISCPRPFLESNTRGVFSILETIIKEEDKTKFIQVSTDEVYGEIMEGSFNEESKLEPSNPYSATKAAADMLVLSYCRTYGIDASITRCTNNFGPYQFPEKLIPKTIIRGINDLKIPVYGTGENARDWLYVRDHCSAVVKVLEKGERGEVYNISSGNEIRNIDLVREILDYLGKGEELIEFVEDRPGHDYRYSLDSTKIRKELNWQPTHSHEEALQKTIDWYLENEDWWKPLVDEEILSPTPWKENW